MQRINSLATQFVQNNTADKFEHLSLAPPDPILGTALAYKADKDANKVNLGIGAYRDNNGKPYVFSVVRDAVDMIAAEVRNGKTDKEYLPIDGLASFNKLAQKLTFGDDHPMVKDGRIVTIQSLSGTGALRVGFEFIKQFMCGDVYVSSPTWGNHHQIIERAGLKFHQYPYFHPQTKGLDFDGMMNSLSQAKPGSIVLLHACAHNPTGVDPTHEQWRQIARLCKKNGLFPFFDSAYLGYASGDLATDRASYLIFLEEGLQLILAQSFAKNIGLYGERIGALHFVCTNADVAKRLLSQVKGVVRPMFSNPPLHGAQIVAKVLGDPSLRSRWEAELKEVSGRINKMRVLLREELTKIGTKGNWDHITKQIGMFSFTGMTKKQCEILIDQYHIYLLKNGRISMAGINDNNYQYLAQSMKKAIDATN